MNDEILLGDPSGQATATYWDSWFQSICIPTGRSFEWYTGPSEVERMLKLHLSTNDKDEIFDKKCIIHPGSGNSLLPIYLRDKYPTLYQSVVDCSEVAIQEMKSRHDLLYKNHEKQNQNTQSSSQSCRIDYLVADLLLNDSLSKEEDKFHAWVDKGFVDALFSSFDESQKISCRQLFEKSNRILTSSEIKNDSDLEGRFGGVCLVVTLAQEHSLQLMLDSIDYINHKYSNESKNCWKPIIHIYELEPLQKGASSLCPFGFLFEKSNYVDKSKPPTVIFHRQNGDEEYIHGTDTSNFTILFKDIHDKLENIRLDFAKSQKEDKAKKLETKRLVLTTLEIKPSCDFEMSSLEDLSKKITMCSDYEKVFTSLTWRKTNIVPIGFGISKLAMECLIDSEQVEDLCDLIMDTEGEDIVQSVDIDWDATVPVGDAMSCLQKSK